MDKTEDTLSIPINHATLMYNIINVVSRRGAFAPEEFKPVGEIFEYLKKELKIEDKQDQTSKQSSAPMP